METDPKVLQALALLREAGRLDLVAPEALSPGRLVRRAAAGVAAAVAACSPPRSTSSGKVSLSKGRAWREAGPATGRAGRGRGMRGSKASEPARGSLGEHQKRRARAGESKARRGPVVRRYGALHGATPKKGGTGGIHGSGQTGQPGSGCREGAGDRVFGGGASKASGDRKLPPASGKLETGGSEEQRDPKVPISVKWPTMLVWSSSEEEVVQGGEGDSESAGEGPSALEEEGAPGRGFGPQGGGTSGEEEGSSVEGEVAEEFSGRERQVAEGIFLPSTPDLFEQGPLDFDEEDPGEQRAALVPWEEVKASPRAASRMASTGRCGRRRRVADTSSRLCGGLGHAPPNATAWEEQRLGPRRRRGTERVSAGCACCHGKGEWGVRKGSDVEERMSEVSLEEGELRNSGSENEWWEQQGQGVSNPVRQSLQVSQVGRRSSASQERLGGEQRKVQERPPLLSPGPSVFDWKDQKELHIIFDPIVDSKY
ncbi:hypothetical protein NDU88_003308 [Pleurodeles waltl]|uniref:Uncharacterized protein n=1 Tax=Pleurodeles waltl TaxID=8319 RepID=A0AAV7UY31_PLEWA|nr:hypothetical protein NDU88_003308 [Pleurodeles waltl]